MFEFLMGLAVIWVVWLVSLAIDTEKHNETTHRRRVHGKVKRNKDFRRTT
jgi:hypothetical protein